MRAFVCVYALGLFVLFYCFSFVACNFSSFLFSIYLHLFLYLLSQFLFCTALLSFFVSLFLLFCIFFVSFTHLLFFVLATARVFVRLAFMWNDVLSCICLLYCMRLICASKSVRKSNEHDCGRMNVV